MPAPFHNIFGKCDRALAAYIILQGAGTPDDTWPAKRSQNKSLPCTVCWSHTGSPIAEAPYSGLYKVEAFIEIRSSGVQLPDEAENDPRMNAELRLGKVCDLFWQGEGMSGEGLGDLLTAAARQSDETDLLDFTALSVRFIEINQGFNPRTLNQQGSAWVDSIHLEIICAPADVS